MKQNGEKGSALGYCKISNSQTEV